MTILSGVFIKNINIEIQKGDYDFRFCNFFDKRAREFEEEIRHNPSSDYSLVDDSGFLQEVTWPNLSFWQSYRYLDYQTSPFYILQMSNFKKNYYYQIAIQVEVSKVSLFQIGTVEKWIMLTNPDRVNDQVEFIRELLRCCKQYTKLMRLRIRPYMPGSEQVDRVHNVLSTIGFKDVSPTSYVKTRIMDLRPSVEKILSTFSTNGRARLKIKEKFSKEVSVKEISDVAVIPHLQRALDASYLRSTHKKCPYSFNYLFANAGEAGRKIIMLGFFFEDLLLAPKAFITGIQHSEVVEFSVGGSLSDAKLRRFPFNHLLMWQLALTAKKNGSKFLDMGGIAIGEENNALSGITNFKRLFPGFELLVGREMQIHLRSNYSLIYNMLHTISSWTSANIYPCFIRLLYRHIPSLQKREN